MAEQIMSEEQQKQQQQWAAAAAAGVVPLSSAEEIQVCSDASFPVQSGSVSTPEELEHLSSDEAVALGKMMKELENLLHSNGSDGARAMEMGTAGAEEDDDGSLDAISIESWKSGLLDDELCSSSSSEWNSTPIANRGRNEEPAMTTTSPSSSSGSIEQQQQPSTGRSFEEQRAPAGRVDLISMLQQCLALNLAAKKNEPAAAATRSKIRPKEPPPPQKKTKTKKKKKQQQEMTSNAVVASLRSAIQQRHGRELGISQHESSERMFITAMPRDLMALLHDCAHAVAMRDVTNASSLAMAIRRDGGAAPLAADPRQRLAFYFVEALMARALGTARELTSSAKAPSPEELETIYEFRVQATPSPLLPHFFSTQAILAAFHGRSRVHIVDVGMARNRFQWSLLLHALAFRPGGPPSSLRITAVDAPQHRKLVEEIGQKIMEQAASLGMPETKYESAIVEVESWETGLRRIRIRGRADDEAVAVNALFALDWLEDETPVSARSPRRAVLAGLRQMKPDVVVLGINDGRPAAAHFSFLERFSQAATRFGAKFDAAAECCGGQSGNNNQAGRAAYEGRFLAPEILNLLACEGTDRVVRTAPYEEWHRAMLGAGFHVVPMNRGTFGRARAMVAGYNRQFDVEQDGGWMKLSWKKVTTQCVSAWRPLLQLDHAR